MVYSYSILTSKYFSRDFGGELAGMGVCDDLAHCFLYSLNLGLRNGGGIGDSMNLFSKEDPMFGVKILFDLSYFALINIVSLNIIFGIIIDSFAELRDAHNCRIDNLNNVCFICSYTRDQFDKEDINFDNHVAYEHHPILYINYLVYLKNKHKDEFDGIEDYVFSQLKKGRTHWAPVLNTNFIRVESEGGEDVLGRIEEFLETQRQENFELREKIDGLAEMVRGKGNSLTSSEGKSGSSSKRDMVDVNKAL